MNKISVGQRIQKERESIIKMYEDGTRIPDIAKEYDVEQSTVYRWLSKWKIKVKKGTYRYKKKPRKHWKRKFSPEFLAHRAEMTKLYEKQTECTGYEDTTEDQKLVTNIISRPII